MMLTASDSPRARCDTNVVAPPKMSQTMLMNAHSVPRSADLSSTMSLPNGNRASWASLKHCKPKGMPTTVTHKIAPPITYCKAITNPPPSVAHNTFNKSCIATV